MEIDTELVIKVVAAGFPALLIVLGWVSYMSGTGLGGLGLGDLGLKSFGIGLIVIGVVLYIIELIIYVYSTL